MKFMIGTDRTGFQYKVAGQFKDVNINVGGFDEVTRYSWRYGDSGPKTEIMLEKSWKIPAGTYSMGGVPIKADVSPGLRKNVTSGSGVSGSLNFDFGVVGTNYKASIELRGPGG